MLIGHEFERESSYSRQSSFQFLQSCSLKMAYAAAVRPQPQDPAAVDRAMRHLRRLLADHGLHRRRRSGDHDRLGHVGLQGHSGGGEQMAELIATERTPDLIAPSRCRGSPPITRWPTRDRRERADVDDHVPNCGPRPVEEFRFGGELAGAPAHRTDDLDRDLDRVWMFTNVDGVQIERWFHEAGCHRWHTARRDTTVDRFVDG
jgi:heterotetrameric sarcosine oxidase delta subunit